MNTMAKLTLAAAAAAALGAATSASTAYAGSNFNGPQLTGIALESLEAHGPSVAAVALPSGETVEPHQPATPSDDGADQR